MGLSHIWLPTKSLACQITPNNLLVHPLPPTPLTVSFIIFLTTFQEMTLLQSSWQPTVKMKNNIRDRRPYSFLLLYTCQQMDLIAILIYQIYFTTV